MPARERTFRTEGLIISHSNFGEADRIITLFSPHQGKLRAVVKGARRVSSRLAGHVEPLTYVTLQLVQGRNFYLVGQVRMDQPFRRIRDDLFLLSYAFEALRMVDYFVHEGEENLELFKLLMSFLRICEQGKDPAMAFLAFQWKVLGFAGYRPRVESCVVCGSDNPLVAFSPSQGGTLCASCSSKVADGRRVGPGALALMRRLQHQPYVRVCSLKYDNWVAPEVQLLANAYIKHISEGKVEVGAVAAKLRESIA